MVFQNILFTEKDRLTRGVREFVLSLIMKLSALQVAVPDILVTLKLLP